MSERYQIYPPKQSAVFLITCFSR